MRLTRCKEKEILAPLFEYLVAKVRERDENEQEEENGNGERKDTRVSTADGERLVRVETARSFAHYFAHVY